jgi:hypothetical protein
MNAVRVGTVIATLALIVSARAQTPDPLLERATAAAVRAGQSWRGVVAREQYAQHFRTWPGMPPTQPGRGPAVVSRQLVADLLLAYDADGPWELHRDVRTVDGRAVADREDRLRMLFLSPDRDARERMRAVTLESSRFNLGDMTRTFNVPTLPLVVVHPMHARRFNLTVRATRAGRDAGRREIRFRERASPTLVRSTLGRDVPLKGRLIVDDVSGELVSAVIEPEVTGVMARIEVTFGRVQDLPMRVPVRMWEWYHKAGPITDPRVQGGREIFNTYIDAVATYSDFRHYAVTTQERIDQAASAVGRTMPAARKR